MLASLPRLGVGISAEFESARRGIDALALREAEPGLVDFLEYGCDLARGLDDHARRWAAAGLPATYHFLDLNLTEPDDADADWLAATGALARELGAAWLCGDGGLWHFGPRDRGHETLLPPVLTADSAAEMAQAIRRVAEATGMAVLPENPPAPIYLGDLHILDYFARVAEGSGGGLLLDCAHLAIFQRVKGHAPLTGLDGFPLDRVVEMHVAGGVERDTDGFPWVEDDHQPEPLPDTWQIFEHVAARAPNLRAVVYECERNPPGEVTGNFRRIRHTLGWS
ncbi:MAG TPA: DUF692 family protein [Kofleriaceae bacterium]|nr:DUF692 family protein [Kofleriaceae bacterium]